MDHASEIQKYLMTGKCCTEALVRVGLDILGEENNPTLVNAAAGLCIGMHNKSVCGGLTGGCMLLAMADRSLAPEMCQEFYEWFETRFESEFGSVNCSDILGTDPWNRMKHCVPLMQEVMEECAEILEDRGLI
ncbi:MAG: C_GCAxxG_C_C family protein [Lachnospiraceae bacterium]|nr:C_GCAxxG_C_C family protein [Lachnospiraceae bacterium]